MGTGNEQLHSFLQINARIVLRSEDMQTIAEYNTGTATFTSSFRFIIAKTLRQMKNGSSISFKSEKTYSALFNRLASFSKRRESKYLTTHSARPPMV